MEMAPKAQHLLCATCRATTHRDSIAIVVQKVSNDINHDAASASSSTTSLSASPSALQLGSSGERTAVTVLTKVGGQWGTKLDAVVGCILRIVKQSPPT